MTDSAASCGSNRYFYSAVKLFLPGVETKNKTLAARAMFVTLMHPVSLLPCALCLHNCCTEYGTLNK